MLLNALQKQSRWDTVKADTICHYFKAGIANMTHVGEEVKNHSPSGKRPLQTFKKNWWPLTKELMVTAEVSKQDIVDKIQE